MVPGWSKRGSVNSYMGTVGPPGGIEGGGGVKIDFRKTSFLSVSRRNFFLKFQEASPRVKKSVNLTFNAFLHRNFSSSYIMVPGGVMKG